MKPLSKSKTNLTKTANLSFQKDPLKYIVNHIDNVVQNLNTSKIFAGMMIILLNIGAKFINIKLSKSVEGYLKYTFSKQILVFAITWMGTRDIYISLIFTVLFTAIFEFLFNENSKYCCLPESFTNYHTEMLKNEGMENRTITQEDIDKANAILEKAKAQSLETESQSPSLTELSQTVDVVNPIPTDSVPAVKIEEFQSMGSETSMAFARY